jgi:protein TonB
VDVPPPVVPPPLIELPAFEGPSNAISAQVKETPRAQPQTPARQVAVTPPKLKARADRINAAINACYPSASRRLSEEGRAVATVTIGADGKAGAITVTQSSGFPRLDAAVECVVRRLPFDPAKRDGAAVDAQVSLPVQFKLE